VIVVEPPGAPDLLVVGVVRGLVEEVPKAIARVEAFRPTVIGLGLTPEEAGSLQEHFVGAATEPVVPLATTETTEARTLVRYGEVAVPHPTYLAFLEWGKARGIEVVGIDADEDVQAEMFVANIGYVELVRRTVGERAVGRRPPDAPDADAFALAWDAKAHPGRGSAKYATARETAVATNVAGLRKDRGRVAVIVDRERAERVAQLIGTAKAR
jgi:hypothetical protein